MPGRNERSKISAAAKLRTLDLYLDLKSFKEVAEVLEITPSAVRTRLHALNILKVPVTFHEQQYVESIRTSLEREVAEEQEAGIQLPDVGTEWQPLTLDEEIRTLEAFIEHSRYQTTARALGIDASTAKDRLVKLLGEGRTYPTHAKVVLARLKRKRTALAYKFPKRKRTDDG